MSKLPETIWHFWVRSFDGNGIDHKIIIATADLIICNGIDQKIITAAGLPLHVTGLTSK